MPPKRKGDDKVYVEYSKGKQELWQFFLRTAEGDYAKCVVAQDGRQCGTTLAMGTSKSTTTLSNHLRQIHKINIKTPNGGAGDIPVKKVKESMHEKLSKLAAVDGMPFRMISNSTTLRELFLAAECYRLPLSANTVREMILSFYRKVQDDLRREFAGLKAAGTLFSLTMDEWTSLRSRRYAGINVHTSGGQSYCLGFVRCFGSLPAENAHALVNAAISRFGLESKDIMGITTDAAAVMVKMGGMLPYQHQQCIAHGLHLAVMDVLYSSQPFLMSTDESFDPYHLGVEEENDDLDKHGVFDFERTDETSEMSISRYYNLRKLISKVRDVVSVFRHSPVRRDTLNKHVVADHGREIAPISDCKTRWNSTFEMVKRFLKIRVSLVKALADCGLGNDHHFSQSDLDDLSIVSSGLEVVQQTLVVLCSRNATLLTMDAALKCMLDDINRAEPFGAALYTALVKRISERRTVASNVVQYLRNGAIKSENPAFKPSTIEELDLFITDTWSRLNPSDSIVEASPNLGASGVEASPISSGSVDFAERLRTTIRDQCEDIPVNFARGPIGELQAELNSFHMNFVRGPKLEALYANLKSIQVTSVESERSFSLGGRYCNKLRSRLGDESVSALVFLHYYFKRTER